MFNLGIKTRPEQEQVLNFMNERITEAQQLGRQPFDDKHTYQFYLNRGRDDIHALHQVL